MGTFQWLHNSFSPLPIAVQFGGDVIRLMQIKGNTEPELEGAVEVASGDFAGIGEALSSFHGKQCVVCLPPTDVLLQHIRVGIDADDAVIKAELIKKDARWENTEIRKVCVKTTGSHPSSRQELLCVGVNRKVSEDIVQNLESVGAKVIAVTVPLYASIRAFDKLYRRDGDEKITSMLIDMDENSSLVMIAHGASCVFAHRIESCANAVDEKWESTHVQEPALLQIAGTNKGEFERREDSKPRGLREVQNNSQGIEEHIAGELERCLRHHDALFPDRAVDRVIFTGCGANDTDRCASIATTLGLEGYISDPSAWISGASDLAGGPAWTTAAGLCLRYSEIAA
tara:strand:+ start:148 stop:1173 length:1026 start_codon:yes stop_codon:yes gene_type:complete